VATVTNATNEQSTLETLIVLRRFFSDDKCSTRLWSSCCWRAVDGSIRCWLKWLTDWQTSHSLLSQLPKH